jgi:hypothetical protein
MADYPQHTASRAAVASAQGTNLADVLERVLDKGIVIAGDIKLLIADIEVLTLQIRLVVCSVDKAREIGLDWWRGNPAFSAMEKKEPTTARVEEPNTRVPAPLPTPAPLPQAAPTPVPEAVPGSTPAAVTTPASVAAAPAPVAAAPAEDVAKRLERQAELEERLARLERSLGVVPGSS